MKGVVVQREHWNAPHAGFGPENEGRLLGGAWAAPQRMNEKVVVISHSIGDTECAPVQMSGHV